MAIHLRDGFLGTCTSPASGTGAYTSVSAVAGFRSFAALTDGDRVTIAVRSATGWGEDVWATKSGGATPTLTRTRILSTNNGTLSPIDWPPGTPLSIYSTVSGFEIASIIAQNTFEDHQFFNGKRLVLTPDGNTYIYSLANNQFDLVLNGSELITAALGGGSIPYVAVTSADSGALGGPLLILDRASPSPAISDQLASLQWNGRSSTGVNRIYAQLVGGIGAVTNGAEFGSLDCNTLRSGVSTLAWRATGNYVSVFPTFQASTSGLVVGKASGNIADAGCEFRSDGVVIGTTVSLAPIWANRTGSDGTVFEVYRDSVFRASIGIAGSKLTFSGARMQHLTEFPSPVAEDPPIGTVMCSVDQMMDESHPLSVVSTKAADPTVYGVSGGRHEKGMFLVDAGGLGHIRVVGPVAHGDLLETSELPGIARSQMIRPTRWKFWQRAEPDRLVRSSTVAKANGSVPAGEQSTIPCTLMAG